MPVRDLPDLFHLFPGLVRVEGCIKRSDILHDVPSGSAVTASPKASADSTSPGSATGPAEASALRPAAYGIADRASAGSRGI